MRRVFFLTVPMLMLTVLLFYRPQPSAEGQPVNQLPRDTIRRPILSDTFELTQELDSNRRILNEIQGNVQGIKKGVSELVKDRRAERRQVAEKLAKADTVNVTDTVREPYPVTVTVPVDVVDSAMIGKTWMGQLFIHISRCRADRIFKPKQWGKGKF